MSRKLLICAVISALLVSLFPMMALADNVNVTINTSVAVDKIGDKGGINWEEGIIEVIGIGIPPANARSAAQARAMARRAAIADGYRNLAEVIKGVQVDSETNVEMAMVQNDTIKTKVSAFIQGARVVKESQSPDGTYQVLMQVNNRGESGLNGILTQASKNPATPVKPIEIPRSPVTISEPFTGLVVDARGFDVARCANPKIFDQSGREIYTSAHIDFNTQLSRGMVDYAATPEMIQLVESGQSRAGAKPLVVKAVGVRDNNYNVIVSDAVADQILAANASNGASFLQKCSVVIEK